MLQFILALSMLILLGGSQPVVAGTEPVLDTSYRSTQGERVIELIVVVRAPVDRVWNAFTAGDAFSKWAAPFARIDLRVGGQFPRDAAQRWLP
jgi:hypothetical protein